MISKLGVAIKSGCLMGLTAVLAIAYPAPGSLKMTGPSDLVGLYGITDTSNTVTEYGYGGGFTAILNNSQATMFCVDFANNVSIPSGPTAVNISTVTTGSDLSDTRFFGLQSAGFRTITAAEVNANGTLSNADANNVASYLSNTDYFQRYQMAAFLVANYQFVTNSPTSDTYYSDPTNLGIQSAIWMLLDGQAAAFLPPDVSQDGDVGIWLTKAANWLSAGGDESLMARFHIISDASITQYTSGSADRLNIGIQEFLSMDPVPEPGPLSLLLLAMFGTIWCARRRAAGATVPTRK